MPIDPSIQRKADAMNKEIQNMNQRHKDSVAAAQDQLKNKVDMLKSKKDQMIDAEKKREDATHAKAANEHVDTREDLTQLVAEATGQGGFDYEKTVNDKLKKHGKADKNSKTAGSSADAPDAKFKHNGKEHNLEIKADHKAMFGQIELHHDGEKWDISDNSKKKYPHTAKSITDTGFLHKVNKQWKKPTGDYHKDLQMGNVDHTHDDAEPIKNHYGKDRKTDYIQIGGHGFYHTGKDEAKLGSPELHGKTQLRARMKNRGTDKKTGKTKYGALVVMSLKDADKSHHDLDAKVKKESHEELVGDMLNEERGAADKHWDIAQGHKEKASLSTKGTEKYHSHMADYHDSMHRYHSDIGQTSHASAHADKAEIHHEKAYEASQSVKESALNPKDPHGDYKAKRKALLDLSMNKDVDQKVVQQRKLDLDKEYSKLKESDASWEAAKEKEKEDRLKPSDKSKLDQVRAMLAKEKKPVKESALDRFRAAAAERMKKHDEIEAKRKEEAEKGKENMSSAIDRLAKHLDKKVNEAHKIGDKVVIHKGPKDVVGKTGHVGEIRKRWAGDTKTYTIDHDQGSIQLKPTHFKSFKEDLDEARMSAAVKLQRAFEREQEKSAASRKRAQELLNPPKKPEPVKESWYTQELMEDAECFTHGYQAAHTGAPKKNPYDKGTKDYSEYEDGYAQGELARRRMQTEATDLRAQLQKHSDAAIAANKAGDDEKVKHHMNKMNAIKDKMAKSIKEEGEGGVPANNAGDGKIAGFAGDAGKKAVMTKKPLQRKTLQDFKKFVSQEHEDI